MVTLMETGSGENGLSLSVVNQSDDDDDCMSTGGSAHSSDFNGSTTDIMVAAMNDDVTAQLAAAGWQKANFNGPVGMAAAAAIISAKKRKRPHAFETNPSIRKRQQNRLLRKLRQTIDEFATRVGQQAVVLVATPGKPTTSFKCFGAKPLEDVVKNLRSMIMDELEAALAQQAPPPVKEDPSLYELPPLIIDGIPTPVEKMTQAQLRAFIPLMLKYSTGRGKPGWGRESTRPPWWPKEVPWANVRMDARPEDEKQKYQQAVLQTISNPDGTVSIIQVDPNNPIITLPDGTTAHVQGVATIHTGQGEGQSVHTVQALAEVGGGQGEGVSVDLNNVTEATLNQDGQLILTGEDGQGYPVSVSGMITVPVSASMYQTVVANIQQIQGSDGTMQVVTPMVHVPKIEPGTGNSSNGNNEVETITVTPHQLVTMNNNGEPQVLQVLSLKDATALSKALSTGVVTSTHDTSNDESQTITSDP